MVFFTHWKQFNGQNFKETKYYNSLKTDEDVGGEENSISPACWYMNK